MRHSSRQRGFTIIELMISTAIFTTILLVILTAITQIGRMYYKGITTSKTQEATRTLVDKISQEIQYSSSSSVTTYAQSGTRNVRCIANSRYFYVLNQKKTSTSYGLWADDSAMGSGLCQNSPSLPALATQTIPTTSPGATNPRELLPDNMRLAKFEVSNSGNLYTISIKVLYGDDDLMEAVDPSTGQTLTPTSSYPQFLVCKGSAVGTQFCAVSELTTTVEKRL